MDEHKGYKHGGACFVELGESREVIFSAAAADGLSTSQPQLDRRLEADLEALARLQGKLPRTVCEQCGHCCQRSESIGAYSIEFHQIARYLRHEIPAEQLAELRRTTEIYQFTRIEYFRHFDQKTGLAQIPCPFITGDGGGCQIYPVRPLLCRQYGLMGLAIDPNDPCKRQCPPRCDKIQIHPDDRKDDWNCCEAFGHTRQLNDISQYYFHHPGENQIGMSFDVLAWLVLFFGMSFDRS